MDVSSIAGASALMQTAQSRQAMSVSMMKQAADQQNQMANMLARNARQAVQPSPSRQSGFSFSTYA